MTPERMEFYEGNARGASIWISPSAVASMVGASTTAGRSETGGILIGRYGPDGWVADVLEATPKPKGSKSGFFWFQRSDKGLTALLEERWQQGLYYLGEWHFHPGGTPTPSGSDIGAMLKVARDEAYRCSAPLLAILGGHPPTNWSVSVTLFRDGRTISLSLAQR
jgi:hypothetical protein